MLLNRLAIAPQGQAKSNAQIFRELAAHMARHDAAFAAPHFAQSDESLCREAMDPEQVNFDQLLHSGLCLARSARGAVCPGRLCHTVR